MKMYPYLENGYKTYNTDVDTYQKIILKQYLRELKKDIKKKFKIRNIYKKINNVNYKISNLIGIFSLGITALGICVISGGIGIGVGGIILIWIGGIGSGISLIYNILNRKMETKINKHCQKKLIKISNKFKYEEEINRILKNDNISEDEFENIKNNLKIINKNYFQ